ncbi:MAG: spore germination protein [Oscillospiraceae bacterium]|nr:spore germination protein [Oscillospiraceae bacterium]
MEKLSQDFEENCRVLDQLIGVGRSYDVIHRTLFVGGRRAKLWVIDGYGQDAVLERIMSVLLRVQEREMRQVQTAREFSDRFVTFSEIGFCSGYTEAATGVFSGKTLLVVEELDEAVAIDAKGYPGRSVEEPADSKVLRGAHDGFVETLVFNTALIRRRIRDTQLTMEAHQLRGRSKSDVVLCYMEDRVRRDILTEVREKLKKIDLDSVTLAQESIAEAMMPPQWYNPFPKVRYTERPDAAAAAVMEGQILLLVDNSPAVMILPVSFFHFLEETNDYYFPPLVGTYLRWIRGTVFFLSLLITPVWYLLVRDPTKLGESWQFLAVQDEVAVPLLLQLFLVEFIVDVLKLASLNTPDTLGHSFSMLGALILGDFAVQARWLASEVLVYMAFVAIANFVQPSYELGYAIKLWRMAILIFAGLFGWWGFAAGFALGLLLLATTRPVAGKWYLDPLFPFRPKALSHLLLRHNVKNSK